MDVDRSNLAEQATSLLKRLHPIATGVSIAAALLMIFLLDVQWALAILLAEGIYVGVWLLLDRPSNPPTPHIPTSHEYAAIARSREASISIARSIDWLESWASQTPSGSAVSEIDQVKRAILDSAATQQVKTVVAEIEKMISAIEEDAPANESRLAVAPLYHTRLVGPFDQYLEKLLKMLRREVIIAAAYWEHFENQNLPSFLKAAKEFYQEYHNQDVLDLAALEEILRHNLDSIDDEWIDEDADVHDLESFLLQRPAPKDSPVSTGERKKNGGDR